jgi:hypothetical protein
MHDFVSLTEAPSTFFTIGHNKTLVSYVVPLPMQPKPKSGLSCPYMILISRTCDEPGSRRQYLVVQIPDLVFERTIPVEGVTCQEVKQIPV